MSRPGAKPLLVHIGYHKTATSFLQGRVFSDRRLFSQPWGAQSVEAVEAFILEHPEKFNPVDIRQDFFQKAKGQEARASVISHEALSGQPIGGRYYADRVVDRIHRTFPEARIIIGVREQKSLLVSLYYQYIRMGGFESIENFIHPLVDRKGFRPKVRFDHFEYDLMLSLYRRFWSKNDILILPIEVLQESQERYVQKILNFAGCPDREIDIQKAVNSRRGNMTMQVERFLNRVVSTPNPRPQKYKDYPLLYRVKNRSLTLLDSFGPIHSMGHAAHQHIKSHVEDSVGSYFSGSNRRLSEMTGLDLDALGYF